MGVMVYSFLWGNAGFLSSTVGSLPNIGRRTSWVASGLDARTSNSPHRANLRTEIKLKPIHSFFDPKKPKPKAKPNKKQSNLNLTNPTPSMFEALEPKTLQRQKTLQSKPSSESRLVKLLVLLGDLTDSFGLISYGWSWVVLQIH